jgi:hypothetical protein
MPKFLLEFPAAKTIEESDSQSLAVIQAIHAGLLAAMLEAGWEADDVVKALLMSASLEAAELFGDEDATASLLELADFHRQRLSSDSSGTQ